MKFYKTGLDVTTDHTSLSGSAVANVGSFCRLLPNTTSEPYEAATAYTIENYV